MMRYLPHVLAAMIALCSLAFLFLLQEQACAYPYVTWHEVGDRPLLETWEQVRDARLHGFAEFRIGRELFVVYDLPKEYVDYSAKCVRMP